MVQSETLPHKSSIAEAAASTTADRIVLVQGAILLFSLALLVVPINFLWKEQDRIYFCCVLILLHGCWALWSWRWFTGTLLDPYGLIFLSALLFNAGQALLEVFGLNQDGLMGGQFTSSTLIRTLLLVFCGLAAMHCGAVLAMYRNRGGQRFASGAEPHSRAVALRAIGWTLLAVSAVPLAFQLNEMLSVALSGGYMALYQRPDYAAGTVSARIILSDFVVPGAFFLLAGNEGRRREAFFAAVVLVLYACVLLFLGFRGISVMPLVAAAWLWDRCVRRLPRALLTAFAAVLLIGVFPLVRETRQSPGSERKSAKVLVQAYSEVENPMVSMFTEMGKSMATIAHTIELVPATQNYELGVEYAYAMLTVMPSLFWYRHPTIARGVPSIWLIEHVEPWVAREGGGIGFSFIAEAFLNFGTWGIPVICLLLGYLVVRFYLWAERGGSAARFAVVAAFLPHLLFYARGDLTDLPRAFAWYAFAPYGLYLLLDRRLRRRKQQLSSR